MAKLYCEIESEKTGKHQIGNQFLELKIFYGSKQHSELLTHIIVKPENARETLQFFQYNTIDPKQMVKAVTQ